MHSKNPEKNDSVMEDARITAYVFGQLNTEELQAFEELLENDPRYQAAVEEMRRVASLLESVAATELAETTWLSDSKVHSLEIAINGPSPADQGESMSVMKESSEWREHKSGWLGISISLAAAAALGGVLLWSGQQSDKEKQLGTVAEANRDLAREVEEAKALTEELPAARRTQQVVTAESRATRQVNEYTQGPTPELYESVQESESLKKSSSLAANSELAIAQQPTSPGASGQAPTNTVTTGQPGIGLDYPSMPSQNAAPFDSARPNKVGADMAMGGMGMGGMGGMGMGGRGMAMDGSEVMGGNGGYGGYGSGGDSLGRGLGPGHMEGRFRERDAHPFKPGGGYGDTYERITDNSFMKVTDHPLSTFSIDVDTASYSKVRMMLQQYNRLPPADAVRIEEMLNYFSYQYQGPENDEVPFAANMELASCPWNEQHKLARIAIKGKEVTNQERAVSNLVFLLDVSGSMNEPNKLPLVRRGLEMMLGRLGENDRIAIVVYAGAAGLVLESTTADKKEVIFEALDRLQAGGSTNGGQGIQLAYQTARDHFVKGGTNRVILCTDGDFNVGTTGTEQLVEMVEKEAKSGIFLTVLGFGTGNLNDAMLEAISGRGDGNYAFIDTSTESHKVLVQQLSGTLVTIAKDVKIQVEFNPSLVDSYRLIGYENRILAAEDFADDTKDAGEIGAGHTVTALYEIVPAGAARTATEELKYQPKPSELETVVVAEEYKDELLTLKLRYKAPEGGASQLLEFPIKNSDTLIKDASSDFRFAASVAGFGMLLRNSPHRGSANFEQIRKLARGSVGEDSMGLRAEFLGLIDIATQLSQVSTGR